MAAQTPGGGGTDEPRSRGGPAVAVTDAAVPAGAADARGAGGAVRVRVEHDPRVNFALQQNGVPFVQRIVVENGTGADLADVVVEVTTAPDVAEPTTVRIDRIVAGRSHEISPIDVRLRPEVLVAQQEREAGTLRVRVTAAGAVVAETSVPFEVLAYDEWSGTASLPELLAAFVLPNHPAVETILGAARDLLGDRTGKPSLEGYQGRDPARALAIVEAIYDAVAALGLTYTNPPASFESHGQKVRTPDRIVEARMATCLDLALLFAAAIEQAGLHPLVVLVEGHAFAGAWLVDDSFPETATTEPYRILKRVELDTIRVFETTGVTARPQLSFADAVRAGRRRLDDVDRFLVSVDVRSARRARIRPIPLRAAPGTVAVVTEIREVADGADRDADRGPLRPHVPDDSTDAAAPRDASSTDETPKGRLVRWKRKLLDLTLRNRLLNHRDTKQTIPLLLPDLVRIEDALAAGAALEVVPKPQVRDEGDPRAAPTGAPGADHAMQDALRAFLAEELGARRLHAQLGADDLAERLLEISRGARLSLEEGGANTLYLALGFLAWYETPTSADPRLAPILLVPVALERRTALDTFRLRLVDDDVRLNVTLLQKLASEYGVEVRGLDPLPEDDRGVDVAAVLRAVREAILHVPRWHVTEDAAVGLFSFTKYLMWLDLEARRDVLARNDVVRHLLAGGGDAFDAGGSFPDESTLDATRDPATTFCPLDADSSQLAAVHAAADGRTFVLQGPPGTGKSQTITNVIAQCLATGKKVLFVSEKMAALDVVHRRLERVGLGPFCLPLHSNKAQKKDVLARIGAALEIGAQTPPAGWDAQARELQDVRATLNRTCSALHAPRAFGLTAFHALSRLIALRDEHEAAIELDDPAAAAPDLLARLHASVATLAAEARETGGVPGHPLFAVRLDRWQPQVEGETRRLGADVATTAGAVEAAASPVAAAMALSASAWSASDLGLMGEFCALLATAPAAAVRGLVAASEWETTSTAATQTIARGRDRDARRAAILSRYTAAIFDAPLDMWLATLRTAQASWAPIRWWKGRGVRRDMDALRIAPGDLDDGARIRDLDEALALRGITRDLTLPDAAGARLFGAAWRSGEADWDALDAAVAWAGRCRELLARAAGTSIDERLRLRDAWLRLVTEGRDLFLRNGELSGDFARFVETRARHDAARAAFVSALRIDETAAFGGTDAPGVLARTAQAATTIAANAGRLRAWCGWQRARAESIVLGLGPLVADFESGTVPLDRLGACFERSFHAWWLRRVLAYDPTLAEFSSTRHALVIDRFRELERQILETTVGVVRARLAAALPRMDPNVPAKGEMGTLRRELQKKSRHMPLRKLFAQIPNALARLKPCMLMSPLSVAQYLAAEHPAFDVVVFDEASQIPVWDAIGAIARGTRLVVVGDSRQLPPTSFFEKEESEEDLDEDDVEDLESILDECVAAGLPERTLDWHYRSRHESLIAFSNRHYYKDRLLTFPSAEASVARLGVSLRAVPDGVYDKGHTRSNRREAEELVAEIVRRLRDPGEFKRSLGVVTFSMAQQTLVENLLEDARKRFPEIEPFFSADLPEPLFVKNLENVQGDERDVILFSVCYGPDAQRRVYMNFGPLNRTGGERRLNVAITRAREQVVVFSTLRADQIDLARTRAVGVRDLKSFLEYAERGTSALDAAAAPTGGENESPFESAVERALEARGWTVHRQIGCSGYRVDLGVVAPDRPGRYVLGIECDGASYHSGRTARDRDRLRAAVLRNLGWRLHRVWSTDWWYEPAREIARIEAAIEAAIDEDRRAAAAVDAGTAAAVAATDGGGGGRVAESSAPVYGARTSADGNEHDDDDAADGPAAFASSAGAATSAAAPRSSDAPRTSAPQGSTSAMKAPTSAVQAPTSAASAPTVSCAPPAAPVYPAPLDAPARGGPETFPLRRSDVAVSEALEDVVAVEAPITFDLATRRVAALWGLPRVTARVVERVEGVLAFARVRVSRDDGDVVLWRADQDPSVFATFRRPSDAAAPERTADQIPLVELVPAVVYVLDAHLSVPQADLARDVARVFGIQRLGTNVRERIDLAITVAARHGRCRIDAGVVTLVK